ncbi:phosphotransferase [Chondrinema litorale]|uniref:phosphotransferase n=1 Tax=Chondrinema litorale TaxID=2994555 RepID=UPI002542C0DA|nr:phosphotransferase [Chondrinema litorale]UZR93478.1 phosphotransferase [Chondrinema litorale]
MSKIPVVESKLSAAHLAVFVREKYGFSANTACRMLKAGMNHTYLVSDNEQKYIFRVYNYNWRSEVEINEEIRLLNLLKENQVSVSSPVTDLSNNYILKIEAPEGIRNAVLFTYAEGEKLRELTESSCFNIGILMGKIHQLTEGFSIDRISYNPETLAELPYLYATKYLTPTTDEMVYVKKSAAYIKDVFSNADESQIRKGSVHLDIWYDNMSVKNGTEITIFDFDFCGNGWLLLDVAYFIMQLFHTEPDKEKLKLKTAEFFKGYETITKLSDEEKRLLPVAGLAIWIFYLGVQAQTFITFSNVFYSDNYAKRFIGMVKAWMAYNEIEIK